MFCGSTAFLRRMNDILTSDPFRAKSRCLHHNVKLALNGSRLWGKRYVRRYPPCSLLYGSKITLEDSSRTASEHRSDPPFTEEYDAKDSLSRRSRKLFPRKLTNMEIQLGNWIFVKFPQKERRLVFTSGAAGRGRACVTSLLLAAFVRFRNFTNISVCDPSRRNITLS